jgi:Zn-dependent protease
MNRQKLNNLPRLAEGAKESLDAVGFRLDVPTPRETDDTVAEYVPISRARRWRVPIILLVASILSMTWAGLTAWAPVETLGTAYENESLFEVRRSILANWIPGLIFSLSLTAILGAHELGHYLATRYYKIRSTPPLFIPFPISPIGTCGAVILMDGRQADRKQIFDIGIAGPLAGIVIAIPVAIAGLLYDLPLRSTSQASYVFGQPLLIQFLSWGFSTSSAVTLAPSDFTYLPEALRMPWVSGISNVDMNPLLMAAWVGMLVTGLNMIPISQLDGGHVIFGLLGRRSKMVSWVTYGLCVAYVILAAILFRQGMFILMLILVSFMGIAHPPSRNDDVQLGSIRQALGWLALTLPILCIPLRPVALAM